MYNVNQNIAKKVSTTLDKEVTYKKSDIPKLLAKANIAAQHSRDNEEIIEELQDMGYKIVENKIYKFNEFLNEGLFDKKIKIGSIVKCKKDSHFNSKYSELPSIYTFEDGKEYNVIDVDDNSVRIESNRTDLSDKKASELFKLKYDKYFPYFYDYFEILK